MLSIMKHLCKRGLIYITFLDTISILQEKGGLRKNKFNEPQKAGQIATRPFFLCVATKGFDQRSLKYLLVFKTD